jgi:hypothetical protein
VVYFPAPPPPETAYQKDGAPILERKVGLEPTSPYGKYGALQSCVRKNYRVDSAAFAHNSIGKTRWGKPGEGLGLWSGAERRNRKKGRGRK